MMVLAANCGPNLGIAGEQAAAVGKTRGEIQTYQVLCPRSMATTERSFKISVNSSWETSSTLSRAP